MKEITSPLPPLLTVSQPFSSRQPEAILKIDLLYESSSPRILPWLRPHPVALRDSVNSQQRKLWSLTTYTDSLLPCPTPSSCFQDKLTSNPSPVLSHLHSQYHSATPEEFGCASRNSSFTSTEIQFRHHSSPKRELSTSHRGGKVSLPEQTSFINTSCTLWNYLFHFLNFISLTRSKPLKQLKHRACILTPVRKSLPGM